MCKQCEPEFNAWFKKLKKKETKRISPQINNLEMFSDYFLECWHEAICIGQQEGALQEDKVIRDMSEPDLREFING